MLYIYACISALSEHDYWKESHMPEIYKDLILMGENKRYMNIYINVGYLDAEIYEPMGDGF